jgi:hypothetical protein
MFRRLLQWAGLILLLVGCQGQRATMPKAVTGTMPPRSIPSSTVPPSVSANDIHDKEQTDRQMAEFLASNPGGIGYGLRGTYAETVPAASTTFRVTPGAPFIGEFFLRSGRDEEHSYGFLCLLDYIQVPFSHKANRYEVREGISEGDAVGIPVEINVEGEGLHDVVVVFQEDPSLPGPAGSDSFQNRTLRDVNFARSSISIAGAVAAPHVDYLRPPSHGPYHDALPGFIVSDLQEPRGPQGGWHIWTEANAEAGKTLEFYLHLGREQDQRYAVVEFVDFEQVPIYYEGKAHIPLFILSQASTWHTMPVQIPVPAKPGKHELRILAIGEPFARLDALSDAEQDGLTPRPYSSARILLQVE